MATLKRKHDNQGGAVEQTSSKRQRTELDPRLKGMEPFYWNEPLTSKLTYSPGAVTQSPTLRRRKSSTTAPDTQQVTYLIGKKGPDQPDDKHAVVNLHVRKKDVEKCLAFLEKFSPSDNNSLVARLVQSPILSNVNSLEIRSWSAEARTPNYPAEIELWQRPDPIDTPSVATVSPYPQHVSISLQNTCEPERSGVPEPERIIIVPEFDDLQASLIALRGKLIASLFARNIPTMAEMGNHPSSKLTNLNGEKLVNWTGSMELIHLDEETCASVRSIAGCMNVISQTSTIFVVYALSRLIVSFPTESGCIRDMILNTIAQSDHRYLDPVFQSIVKSIVPRNHLMVSAASLYARCAIDILAPELVKTDAVVFELRLCLAALHGLSGEKNSALSVLRKLGSILESSQATIDLYELEEYLYGLAYTYKCLNEYESALNYLEWHLNVSMARDVYYTSYTAVILHEIAMCYSNLSLYERAYAASLEALNVAQRSADGVTTRTMCYYGSCLDTSYNLLLQYRHEITQRKSEAFSFVS